MKLRRMRRALPRLLGPSTLLAALSIAPSVEADGSIVAPAAAGQQALAVRASEKGITARVCAGAGECSADGGVRIEVGPDVAPLLGRARVTKVALADGKSVARVDVPGAQEPASWVALVAAPLAGKGSEPVVLFSGWTGMSKGEHGEGRSAVVIEERLAKGSRVVIGERREDVTICGRPTVVAASEIDPASMSIARRASIQNITPEERAKAVKIAASRLSAAPPPGGVRLLRATAASSAVEKKFAAITDGDPATAWLENKPGDGRGEFVSFSSASDVGVRSIEITLLPEADGAAPKTLFLASTDALIEVSIPDAPERKAGGVYEVKLPAEMKTSCLALVLEDAYAARGDKNARVAVAEVIARSSLGDLDPEALVGALAGGGERAKAAAALLARGGSAATRSALAGYAKLDAEGKALALSVIDAAPCSESAAFFTALLGAETSVDRARGAKSLERPVDPDEEPEVAHALDRIRRCGRASALPLAELVGGASDRARILAANELSLVAPAESVPVLLDAIPKASDVVRRALRAALAHAAKSDRSRAALAAELALDRYKARPLVARIDLLRAAAPRLSAIDGASAAFDSVATPGADFRTRFLLLSPAAELARSGDARAEAFVRAAISKDPDAHVRARAAEVAGHVAALSSDLVGALGDPEPRVREGAITGLALALSSGAKPTDAMSSAIAARLASDPWTFVRSPAASALGLLPSGASTDGALAAALSDASAEVRGRALDALGAHKASAFAPQIRERSEDKEESVEVRARAILALASMCDAASIDAWTTLAHRAVRPFDERDRRLGSAAVAALGVIHPKDLDARLAPLLAKDAPSSARELARAALSARGECK